MLQIYDFILSIIQTLKNFIVKNTIESKIS